MIYFVQNLVEDSKTKKVRFADTKVFAVDDEMAFAVSKALCNTNGYKVLEQSVKFKR